MRIVIQQPSCIVIDDVLPGRQFAELAAFGMETSLRWTNLNIYKPVWSFYDKSPLCSAFLLVDVAQRKQGGLRALPTPEGVAPKLRANANFADFRPYPTGTPIDRVVEVILRDHALLRRWTRSPEKARAWRSMSAKLFVYPQGTSLDWHHDRLGSYTYYVHEEWKPRWGGELLVCDDPSAELHQVQSGIFIQPKPNRLVVIKGGGYHKICRVTSLAGENARRAVSGFFNYPDIEQLARQPRLR